ncbi:hypothetical protein GCM10009007_18890 [Formosimonas limnophila]|uniref:Uncharacterized protein n=1 Tax=Formosimonas limnophila TaxID=1384487 RepID=A0A8J3CPC8_9BURK|nr:hypothetical protein [Formosimonas limnophila]GHA78164.1 hypothetical protein GCM10009007_18890 [Formosimonas limnophila]
MTTTIKTQLIQATMVGYAGAKNGGATIYALLDLSHNTLHIHEQKPRAEARFKTAALISNDIALTQCDFLFKDKDIKAAVDAYFYYQNSGRLTFSDSTAGTRPNIETHALTESGFDVRIYDGVTCAQMAVLAACLQAQTSREIMRALNAFEKTNGSDDLIITTV